MSWSQTSHTINQIELLIFLCEQSMLSEARGTVTQWETQTMMIYIYIYIYSSQGFINKSSYKSQETHSSL
jgi:hypothetical protein